jgi:hypothetical protein
LLNESDQWEMRAIGIRRVEDLAGDWSVRDQALAIQRYPLPCVMSCVINKPLQLALAVRNRNKGNSAITRVGLIFPLVEQVSKPVLLRWRQLGDLFEDVFDPAA